jgi:DNA-binding MarR family transcriptional regulator
MDTFLGIMRDVEAALQIRTMTYEYEIIACFFDFDALTPHELSALSRCSHSAFSAILRRLEGRQVIFSEVHPADKRSRIYRLSAKTADFIRQGRIDYGVKSFDDWRETDGDTQLLRIYSSNIRKAVGIRHLTCEYQILLNLYYRSGITNMEFTDIVDASLTKFNSSLRELSEMGLIHSEKDTSDKRIKRYFISAGVKETIEDAYRRFYHWGRGKSLLAGTANSSS